MAVVVKTVLGSHFGVGEFTTHFRTNFSGDWDVHWGYGVLTHGKGGEEVLARTSRTIEPFAQNRFG